MFQCIFFLLCNLKCTGHILNDCDYYHSKIGVLSVDTKKKNSYSLILAKGIEFIFLNTCGCCSINTCLLANWLNKRSCGFFFFHCRSKAYSTLCSQEAARGCAKCLVISVHTTKNICLHQGKQLTQHML